MDELDLSQSELSRKTGISQCTISGYVTGKFIPKDDRKEIIAKALNSTVKELFEVKSINNIQIKFKRNNKVKSSGGRTFGEPFDWIKLSK